MLTRTALVAYRRAAITTDMAEAIRLLELAAANFGGVRLHFKARPQALDWQQAQQEPGPTGFPPQASMWVAGREAQLRLQFTERQTTRWEEVAALWGLAVPLGFVPWNRYPMPGHGDEVFHYLGPWHGLYDHLLSQGRGELAWPSVCCAAQVDLGRWQGDKPVERFVQAQLHRLGHHCGPVDGVVGDRTLAALRAMGLQSKNLNQAAEALLEYDPPEVPEAQRKFAHIIAPGHRIAVNTTGKVYSVRNRQGAALTIDGPGRVIVDVQ